MSRKSQRRHAPTPPPPTLRPKRGAAVKVEDGTNAMTDDKVAELWTEFAADYFEIVDQLPLELHRNSRLLRELDEESLLQQERLERKIREYVGYRVELVTKKVEVEEPGGEGKGQEEENGGAVEVSAEDSTKGQQDGDGNSAKAEDDMPAPDTTTPDHPVADVEERRGRDIDSATELALVEDVALGVVDAAGEEDALGEEDAAGEEDAMGEDDTEEPVVNGPAVADPAVVNPQPNADSSSSPTSVALQPAVPIEPVPTPAPASKTPPRPSLGDIASLVNELVRNREEKVAIAVGAYNTVDRHIRALDAALSTQDISLLKPSEPPEVVQPPSPPGRKRKKRKSDPAAEQQPSSLPVGLPPGIEVDPNEPRYCYCNQVSYGEMVGCDNDDCPHEWFHLSCLGLTAPPAGDWKCETCRPSVANTTASSRKRRR